MSTWFITGCSSGFGHELATAALEHGDKVIATARNPAKIASLKALGAITLALDVTASDADVQKAIAPAIEAAGGKVDILVNNAAYLLQGAVEEISDEEVKAHFTTNVFGQLTVTRAILPYMRAARHGTIAFIGSIAGWRGVAGTGLYAATKFALVGIAEALREEVKHLGIEVTLIEPGYFRTNLLAGSNTVVSKKVVEDLRPVMDGVRERLKKIDGKQPGDPRKAAKVIVEALTKTGRCRGRKLPVRFPLGKDAVGFIADVLDSERKELEEWKGLAATTDHDDVGA